MTLPKEMLTKFWRDLLKNVTEMDNIKLTTRTESSNVMRTVPIDAVDGMLIKEILGSW